MMFWRSMSDVGVVDVLHNEDDELVRSPLALYQ